ncbi:NAD(P)H:quinone oxidoreductase [Glycomyces albus]
MSPLTEDVVAKIAIVYYSATGNLHRLAEAAAEAAEKTGAETRLRRVPEYTDRPITTEFTEWTRACEENAEAIAHISTAAVDDLDWADAILLGGPGRFGLIPAPLKHFIESAWPLNARGGLAGKVMSSFTSTGAPHGGQESTILSLNQVFYHWSGIIVPPGLTAEDPAARANGNPYGTSSASGPRAVPGRLAENVTEDDLAAIRHQTTRMIAIATALAKGFSAN